MVKRLLAVLGAVAMIAGALAYRSRDGDGGPGAGGAGAAGAVVCAEELASVCEAVPNALVEPTSVTFARLVGARSVADAGIGAWISAGPWPEMVDAARVGKPPLFREPEPLASTRLVVVVPKGAAPAPCAAAITWRCLGDAAQDRKFRLAGDPPAAAGHLFIRAAALGGFLGRPDYIKNDIEESLEAESWLSNVDRSLDDAPSFGAGSLEAYLATRGSAHIFVTTEAATQTRQLSAFDIAAPAPAAVVVASVTAAEGASMDIDLGRVIDALSEAGWNVQPPPADDGLPSPGVLVALRERTE